MTVFVPPLPEIRFVLREIAGIERLATLPGLAHATPDLLDAALEEAGKFAAEVLAPLNAVGDRHGAVLENGVVRTAPGFKEAYRTFREGGWTGVVFPEAYGGQDLPWTFNTALADLWNAANMTFEICPLLTRGAVEAILHHGSEAQKRLYATRLISGEWTAAMCLTEPQAGTDLGALRTRAEPRDGHWRLFGQKIFITFGDHDMAENIVHLVLARLPDAPPGTKGISLFIVPKYLPGPDGRPGPRNDWRVLKLEHKVGIHASPTCVIAYGEEEGAVGFLLGEPHRGLACMFTMMNNARLAVGHEGLGLSERAFQAALAWARTRIQGRIDGRPAPILAFPDVRRMLVRMRAQIAAMRALCYWTGSFVDRAARAADPAERRRAADRVALLTPVVKAWCTDLAQEVTHGAIQVHGGMGFVEETGVAQHWRDARILPIYEGTNGIQAIDLVGRKLAMADGRLPWDLVDELRADLDTVPGELRLSLRQGLERFEAATRYVQGASEEHKGAAAAAYLRLFGHTLGAFLLARGARAAAAGATGGEAWPGLARFWCAHLLPETLGLLASVSAGAEGLDPALLDERASTVPIS
ncbi:MAG: acyl-CoA dehydrogenase [Geminicoccaceae bacterium]|nr:MAG: acyl-CoA dehydrogenase [Geminicoccaceae bacterium]